MPRPLSPLRIGLELDDQRASALFYLPDGTLKALRLPGPPAGAELVAALLAGVESEPAGQDSLEGARPIEVVVASRGITRALLSGTGGPIALLTTDGIADSLTIGRARRPAPYDFRPSRSARPLPLQLVAEQNCLGVRERLGRGGEVLHAPSKEHLAELRERVAALSVSAVAVALLHSPANDRNERIVAEALAPLKLPVSLSAHVAPLFREPDRIAAAALDAYLYPVFERELFTALAAAGVRVLIVGSDGCARLLTETLPSRAALSGGAAALLYAQRRLVASELDAALVLEQSGGLSAVALLEGGLERTRSLAVEVDELLLPGPALRLVPRLIPDELTTAERVERYSEALARATEGRGRNACDLPLFALGDDGERTARELASAGVVDRVIVLDAPGLGTAYGALLSPVVYEREHYLQAEASSAQGNGVVAATLRQLSDSLRRGLLSNEGEPEGPAFSIEWAAILRYRGQSQGITLTGVGDGGPAISGATDLVVRFCEEHHRRYGFVHSERGVELLALKVRTQRPVSAPATLAGLVQAP
jgi:N-methylhydantoinase A/oxoprolinase/acetone carboxylase beta subunit